MFPAVEEAGREIYPRTPSGQLCVVKEGLLIQISGLFNVYIGADPIVGRGGVALTGDVFGEECIARAEGYAGAVAQADIDGA